MTIDWEDSTDDRVIWGYLVHRDGVFHELVEFAGEFREPVVAASAHTYVIRTQDGAGNNSGPSQAVNVSVD